MLNKQFIIVAGKGGVGRTTVAAALGTVLARRGRRTLLAHVRCKQRLDEMLGCGVIGEEITAVEPNLFAVNMNPRAAIREIGLMVLRYRAIYRAVLENRIVKYFLRAMPALEEYSMLGKAWFHTSEVDDEGNNKYETVIFDGPATGHLISMLRIPKVILDSVPAGPLVNDARKVDALMSDPARTAMWIVTLAEEMPASEAIDLYSVAKDELKIAVDRLVVNMVYADPCNGDEALASALDDLGEAEGKIAPLVKSARTLKRRHDINSRYVETLGESIAIEQLRLPHLFVPQMDRQALDRIADALDREL